MNAIILDLDGTICNDAPRKHLIKESWEAYHEAAIFDKPMNQRLYRGRSESIIIFTGRPVKYFDDTLAWLEANGVPNIKALLMRPNECRWSQVDLKRHMIYFMEKFLRITVEDVIAAYDDRQEVIDMYQKEYRINSYLIEAGELNV